MKSFRAMALIEKTFVLILLVIFAGIVVHAPLSVGFSSLLPDFDLLIKSWKEILLLLAGGLLLVILFRKKKMSILKRPVLILVALYAAVHVITILPLWNGTLASIAGLMIDLRFVLFFGLVYIAVYLYPLLRPTFIKVGIVGAAVVVTFGFLQVFVLPPDILSYIGYGDDTISPYLTIDKNTDYVRINSTLRGPNPLGAYAMIVLAILLTAALKGKKYLQGMWMSIGLSTLAILSITTLWFSYSRSVALAAFITFVVIIGMTVARRLPVWAWVCSVAVVCGLVGGLIVARDTPFVSNVILHENPAGGSSVSSNDQHAESLAEGVSRLISQPFGAGVGSTGSASYFTETPFIMENQYLFIAHEVGWIGLGLFIALFILIIKKLWSRRSDWLAVGVFASGVGLAVIGLVLPVWVDDTVSIIWWGLAAIAIGGKSNG
jgi:hypothetical protein